MLLEEFAQFRCVAGVDEAGRGPLAGPVYAAAVILDPQRPVEGLMDSKLLSAKNRARLEVLICERALAFSVARAEVWEIDAINILRASLLAMQRAVEGLSIQPDLVLVDGNQTPNLLMEKRAIVKGDQLIAAISAASILAKEARDRDLIQLDKQYPGYGLAKHKGYPTVDHLAALDRLGVTLIHRRSFAPVRNRIVVEVAD